MRLSTKKQAREMTTLSYAQMARLEEEGKFPKRIRLTEHPRGRCAYLYDELVEWVNQRAMKRAEKRHP